MLNNFRSEHRLNEVTYKRFRTISATPQAEWSKNRDITECFLEYSVKYKDKYGNNFLQLLVLEYEYFNQKNDKGIILDIIAAFNVFSLYEGTKNMVGTKNDDGHDAVTLFLEAFTKTMYKNDYFNLILTMLFDLGEGFENILRKNEAKEAFMQMLRYQDFEIERVARRIALLPKEAFEQNFAPDAKGMKELTRDLRIIYELSCEANGRSYTKNDPTFDPIQYASTLCSKQFPNIIAYFTLMFDEHSHIFDKEKAKIAMPVLIKRIAEEGAKLKMKSGIKELGKENYLSLRFHAPELPLFNSSINYECAQNNTTDFISEKCTIPYKEDFLNANVEIETVPGVFEKEKLKVTTRYKIKHWDNMQTHDRFKTTLSIACEKGKLDVVRVLLEEGASIQGYIGDAALRAAERFKNRIEEKDNENPEGLEIANKILSLLKEYGAEKLAEQKIGVGKLSIFCGASLLYKIIRAKEDGQTVQYFFPTNLGSCLVATTIAVPLGIAFGAMAFAGVISATTAMCIVSAAAIATLVVCIKLPSIVETMEMNSV